jgi:uncharacterized protein YcbK (DUF882 family)
MAFSKHFSDEELQCRCGCGKNKVKPELLEALELLRATYNKPMKVNSGYRCRAHNDRIGGHHNSAHCDGLAVDIAVPNSVVRHQLLWSIMRSGEFDGVGISHTFIHLDMKPRSGNVQVVFTY